MTPNEVFTAFYKAMEKTDFETALKYVAPDCAYINMPAPTTVVKGHEGIKAVLVPFFAPFERNEFHIINKVIHGDLIIAERVDKHFHPSGVIVDLPVTGVYLIKDGMIQEYRDYFDMTYITTQIGKLMEKQAKANH
ncbi:putative cytosolic protein [Hyaloraphidium curvatum]|nr:putative cytosolic protein [Hyaloraphidium curvatum]